MNFAPVIPHNIMKPLFGVPHAIGSYNLFEAPIVLEFPEDYSAIGNEIDRKYSEQRTTILDTGVMQGRQVSVEDLLQAAEICKPTHLVLPDVLGKGEQTLLCSLGMLQRLEDIGKRQHYKYMYVLQGETLTEAIGCLKTIMDKVDIIGIPYTWSDRMGSRIPAVMEVLRTINRRQVNFIHLLGFDLNFVVDARFCNVLHDAVTACPEFAMDSSLPILAAQRGWRSICDIEEYAERKQVFESLRAERNPAWWRGGTNYHKRIAEELLYVRATLRNDHTP